MQANGIVMKNTQLIFVFIIVSTLFLSGCSNTFNFLQKPQIETETPVETNDVYDAENSIIIPQTAFHTHSLYYDYTDSIATQLFEQAHISLADNPVIVTSFGYQNRALENNHKLSYELSESIAHELQPFGVKTIAMYQHNELSYLDATGLKINKKLQKEFSKLDAEHILTGVLIANERGIMVRAKIVEIDSMHIISTAEKLIPYYAFN